MNTFKKVLTFLVMLLAALGVALCVAGVIGAWALNAPAKAAATGALSTIEQYVGLAGQTLQVIDANVGEAKRRVDDVNARLAGVTDETRAAFVESVRQQFDETVGPTMARASATARTVWQTANGVNETLITVNRLPGMSVPTFTSELEAAALRLEQANNTLTGLRTAVADPQFDASRVQAAATKASTELDGVQTQLAGVQANLLRVGTATTSAQMAVPGWINGLSVIITMLGVLFGAGQVALFQAARRWFQNL